MATTKTPRKLGGAPAAPAPTKGKKTTAKKPEPAPEPEAPKLIESPLVRETWRLIVFTDLHVSAKTLDRALRLLAHVREVAVSHKADVICLGDFWDQRSTLAVRQLHEVQVEFERWRTAGVRLFMLPGNHDQVSLGGDVNAVRIFEAFDHIVVATQPMIDVNAKVAFFPWRELAGEQAKLFASLEGKGWTVFAHAEVTGAVANSGKPAAGRVSLAEIEPKVRACYVGHYHKRQKLGEKTWYIGSPFEMNFGERDEPHGIAIVDAEHVEPAFLDLDEFPKHYRITWPGEREVLAKTRPHDVIELLMSERDLAGDGIREALKLTKTADVRPVLAPREDKMTGAPAFALTLNEAIDAYVEELRVEFDKHDGDGGPFDAERLVRVGREFLAQVPEARSLTPLAPVVRVKNVSIENFCAIKGRLDLDLRKLGPALLRGPMGSGKTSVCDALTWCFYGATTPRKPGTTGGTLRADDVLHDGTEDVKVRAAVVLVAADGTEREVVIERTKKRGQGAKIRLEGCPIPEGGTADEQQEVIHRVIGLDLDLWRATVYLGQGAVANFITDGDKRRKELLSRAFGLSSCEAALKLVRDAQKRATADVALYRMREAEARSGLDALSSVDFTAQAESWEAQRQAHVQAAHALATECVGHVNAIDPHLANEQAWIDRQKQYDDHISSLAKSLVGSNDARVATLARDLGSVQSERALLEREIGKATEHYTKLMAAKAAGAATCDRCGQVIPQASVDDHLAAHEEEIAKHKITAQSLDARIAQLTSELDGARSGDSAQKEAARTAMDEARASLAKINEALSALAQMKTARAEHVRRYQEAQQTITTRTAETNPFLAQQAEAEARKATLQAAWDEARGKLATCESIVGDLAVWEEGFSAKGLPVLVLRLALHELEAHANSYIARLLSGRVACKLVLDGDDLVVKFYEWNAATSTHVERSYLQLSGGQRRCVELAFSPFALSEMIFARAGVRVSFLIVDELTTHLDPETKPIVCSLLQNIERETVLVIDHDLGVHGEFDVVFDVRRGIDSKVSLGRA